MALDLLTPFTKVELEPDKTTERRAIGIFWGSFNPVHVAHLTIADQVRQQLHLEKVLFLPEQDPSGHIREMLERALSGKTGLEVEACRCTENEGKIKRSIYETLKALKEKMPEVDFYFIIGGDLVGSLVRWDHIDELVELVQFVGVQRPRYRAGTSYPIMWIDVPMMDVSSTQIRTQIQKGLVPNFLLAPKVLAYIKKESLYADT
ncbi:MAG: nicotinate-nucleotide adenylyltransferase [Streptococcaceae bacterium]|jgi:nicotinate-nucleotide adenylyltransferase|nr:nicotinate-nucleotide adenylyltransferase [Streptococcaceae bacterium]